MSFRVFQGHILSAEGWRMCNADECVWVKIPGADVSIQVRSGIPATILPAFIARYNQIVEPVRDADTACWTETNSVSTSNHPAGVAVDINWATHAFHAYNTFGDQLPKLRQVQAEFRGCIQWGGDWGGNPQDEMHHELAHPEGFLDNNRTFVLHVDQELIDLANDLRAGYLGIYVPGITPAPPSHADGYALEIIAEGRRRNITPRGIQIALSVALVESGLKNYANSNVPESLAIPHDAVGSDHDSLGLFQQRCPMWGPANVLMNPALSAGLFYDQLVKLDYNGPNPPGSYAADVQRPARQYRDRYQQRMADAVAIYDRLSNSTQGDDDLSADAERKIDVIYQEVTKKFGSRSRLRYLDEKFSDTVAGFVLNCDGNNHVEFVKLLAAYGHPETMALLREVAGADPAQYPDRVDDSRLAQAILADVTQSPPRAAAVEAAVPQVVYLPAPQPAAPFTAGSTTGQLLGHLFDALEAVKTAQVDLGPQGAASIDSLISVLQPSTQGATA